VLLAGILLLVIAVVGGGFTIERVQVPPVPGWSRVASGVLGVAFMGGFLFSVLRSDTSPEHRADTVEAPSPTAAASPDEGGARVVELFRFAGPDVSPDDLELTDFTGVSAGSDPVVGDSVTLRFTLRNAGRSSVEVSTFVASRSPSDEHADSPESAARPLPPGQTVTTNASVVTDEAGSWSLWPCYPIGERECPDEWQIHTVPVVE
jgi:hypothetical protein